MDEFTFYEYRLIRQPSSVLWGTFVDLVANDEVAAAETTKIEYHLTRGHEHFNKGQYAPALHEYKTAEALIYKLLQPTFNPNLVYGEDIVLTVDQDFVTPLVGTVFELLDHTPDTIVDFEVVPRVATSTLVDPTLVEYNGFGLATERRTQLAADAADTIRLGDRFVMANQLDEAIGQYEHAIELLETDPSPDIDAALRLSLGTALASTGDLAGAAKQLDDARRRFEQLGHRAQAGRASEVLSEVHIERGRFDDAATTLDAAAALYKAAAQHGAPTVTGGGGSGTAGFTSLDALNATARIEGRRNRLASIAPGTRIGRLIDRLPTTARPEALERIEFDVQPVITAGPASAVGGIPTAAASTDTRRVLRLANGIDSSGLPLGVEIALDDPGRVESAIAQIYEVRTNATTLDALGIYTGAFYLADSFKLQIPHHYLFTIRMALGDTYRALGQFDKALAEYVKARSYQYLNQTLEAPKVWVAIARCLNDWAYSRYANNEVGEALDLFRQVLEVDPAGALSLANDSPLYGNDPLAAIKAQVTGFLPTIDDEPPLTIPTEIEIEVRRARSYQLMIHAGLNVLGLPLDLIPIFRFAYLQGVARYFAQQAIKAEREYINFMVNSERETSNLMQLQQAVELADATVDLETRRVEEANAQVEVARRSEDYAELRRQNAVQRRADYVNVSADRVALDTATAHASGGFTETSGGYQVSLSTSGTTVNLGDEDYEIMRNAAWRRGSIMRQFELDDMQRTVDEYAAYRDIAAAQVGVAEARRAVAIESRNIAQLKHSQTEDSLDYAMDKTFNAALWKNLAERMRDFSEIYCDRAIEIAYMMQAAYNFEMDADLDVIKNSYSTGVNLDGLLGADMLLVDIDYFTYHHVTQTKSKHVPIKRVISLADDYPFSLHQFRSTGRAEFETRIADFDRLYPGTYMRKLQAVEVYVEGLVSADGVSGSVSNTGISVFRTRDNTERVRLQPRETAMISSHNLKGDVLIFRPSQETLGVFEESGVATAWTLQLPRGSNDLNYEAISDIKVVLYFNAFHDDLLDETVRAALPTTGERARSQSLRFNHPDRFFQLLDSGTTTFDSGRADFPYNHTNIQLSRVAVYVLTEEGVSPAGVQVEIANAAGGHTATVQTGADGTFGSDQTDASNPLNVFHGDEAIDQWTIAFDRAVNPDLFHEEVPGSGVFRIRGVRDVVINTEYAFTYRPD